MNHSESVVPYVVPGSYPLREPPWSRPLGHDLHVVLAENVGTLITPLEPGSLERFGWASVDAAWETAMSNIETVFTKSVQAQKFGAKSAKDLDLILCGASWLAASCLVMPALHKWASKHLGTGDLLASIPNPEALLLFPRGEPAQRAAMRTRIREAEEGHRKPLTWEFFELTTTGCRPFVEPR